jgi:hypothetical protein
MAASADVTTTCHSMLGTHYDKPSPFTALTTTKSEPHA